MAQMKVLTTRKTEIQRTSTRYDSDPRFSHVTGSKTISTTKRTVWKTSHRTLRFRQHEKVEDFVDSSFASDSGTKLESESGIGSDQDLVIEATMPTHPLRVRLDLSDERNQSSITQKKSSKEASQSDRHPKIRQSHRENESGYTQRPSSVTKAPKAKSSHHDRHSNNNSQSIIGQEPTVVPVSPETKLRGGNLTGLFRSKSKPSNIKSESTKFRHEPQSKFRSPEPKPKPAPTAAPAEAAVRTRVPTGTIAHGHTPLQRLGDMNRSFLVGFEMPTKYSQNMSILVE